MPFGKAFVYQAPKRKKTEVYWSGLTGVVLAADTDYNLVTLLKGLLAPAFGTLENQTNQIVLYRTDVALPAPSVTVGHHLDRGQRDAWSFDPPQNLYARMALPGGGVLVVTEG